MINMFLYLMKLSVRSLVVIPLIIIVRFFIRKQPKIYSYTLWAVVFAGLVVNIQFEIPSLPSAISTVGAITNSVDSRYTELIDDYVGDVSIYHSNTLEYYEAIEKGIVPVSDGEGGSYVVTAKNTVAPPQTVGSSIMPMLAVVWATGVITAVFILLKKLVDFHSRLFTVNIIKENICIADRISSPFVYGIIRPKIYIPSHMADIPLEHIITHEQTHIRRGDHIIKPLCLLITVMHWFNPLVWLAFTLMCKDMEMSCDEAVVSKVGNKKEYSLRLLNCAVDKHANPVRAVLFGESRTENRIKNILAYKQPAKLVSILLTAVVAICFTACMVEEKVGEKIDEIIPSPVPETFYEQLAKVNSIDGMLHENAILCEQGWYSTNTQPLDPGTPKNIVDAVKSDRNHSASFGYNGMRGVVHKVDDVSTGYIAYVFNDKYTGKEDYSHIYAYKYGDESGDYLTFNVPFEEKILTLASGWEKLNDDMSILSYFTTDSNEDIWFNAQIIYTQKNEIALGELNRCKMDKTNWRTPRGVRFLNEKVGFMGQTDMGYIKEGSPESSFTKHEIPYANITIDGGKTWHQLDFSALVYPDYFTGYRSCCMKLNGNRIEIRYFTSYTGNAKPDENGNLPYRTGSESYVVISQDGGLTWAGYLRGYDWDQRKEVFTQVTETIPVQIID